jgi:hypothetical protein
VVSLWERVLPRALKKGDGFSEGVEGAFPQRTTITLVVSRHMHSHLHFAWVSWQDTGLCDLLAARLPASLLETFH